MLTTFLRSLKEMQGYTLHAADGDIGKVHEFYFDDEFWVIRYLVANTGHWLPGRKVLISPFSFDEPEWENKKFPVRLSREDVEKSPDNIEDSHLRNTRDVIGYRIQTLDGDVGYVDDFIVNDADWAIHYIVVDIHRIPGKKVLISPWWVDGISWEKSTIAMQLPKDSVEKSPTYDFSRPVSREYEDQLYKYYGRPKYWG